MCDHGVNPKFKPFEDAPSVYEIALAEKNERALKLFIDANLKVKYSYLEENKEELFKILETLPDFSFSLNFHCDSSILPFVKSLAPKETFII
jgi:hypothetical protein